jgi:hypothetical protein
MSDYLLPCSCGQKLAVSVRQAGQSVRCTCGASLEVPTLRGLRELHPADVQAAARARAWGDRHRVAFVLIALSLGACAVAGYLWIAIPPSPEPQQLIDVDENTPIGTVYAVYQDLQRGLDVEPPGLNYLERALSERREMMLWGARIALALAGCGTIAAVVVLLSAAARKR